MLSYTSLHCTTPHYTTLHYTTLHSTSLHYAQLHFTTLHYTPLHYTPLHSIILRYNYTTLHDTTTTATATTPLHYSTLQYTNYITLRYATPHYTKLHYTTLHCITLQLQLQLRYFTLRYTTLPYITLHSLHHHKCNCNSLHYTSYTTPQLQHHYTTTTTTAALHHTTSSSCGWGDRPGDHSNQCNHSKKTQPQPPFSPSVDLLCHPGFKTTDLSYRFPVFETSATALCGTTGIVLVVVIMIMLTSRFGGPTHSWLSILLVVSPLPINFRGSYGLCSNSLGPLQQIANFQPQFQTLSLLFHPGVQGLGYRFIGWPTQISR